MTYYLKVPITALVSPLSLITLQFDIVYTFPYNLPWKRREMVVRKVSTRDARANFSELLGLVHYTKEPVIVERKGKPFAVVISPEQYELMEKELERAWAVVDRVRERNASNRPDDVLRDVTQAVEAVRHELYEETQRSTSKRRR